MVADLFPELLKPFFVFEPACRQAGLIFESYFFRRLLFAPAFCRLELTLELALELELALAKVYSCI
jgi:hypothetical protein